MAIKIAIANQKGGIGKTTTAVNLAYILARDGKKVLFIDADAQKNSTFLFKAKSEDVGTLYDILIDDPNIDLDQVIQRTEFENLDIIASDEMLRKGVVMMQTDADGQYLMRDVTERVDSLYDYVIFDTNPSLDIMLRAVLTASDVMIIPLYAEAFSAQGLGELAKEIVAVKKRNNPSLNVAGLLLTNYKDRTNLGKGMRENYKDIADKLGTSLFNTVIRTDNKVPESITDARKPVVAWKPNTKASMDYEDFVEELRESGVI